MRIFVINPGSTSTKLALFDGGKAIVSREFQHDKADLAQFTTVMEQRDFRMAAIRSVLAEATIDTSTIAAVAGRGGLLHPLHGGVYEVSDDMLTDLKDAKYGEHPCNLGAILADELAREWDVKAFIVDPVVTDEMMDKARLTGLPDIERRSLFHALNQRGAARTVSARLNVPYETSNFIACHMGGGISIGAHRKGKVVDVVNALDGEGPFSPERTGTLPLIPALELIERREKSPAELKRIVLREGGLFAHLGTNDLREVVSRMEAGDEKSRIVFKSLAYTISKHITSLVPALAPENGATEVTAVILTGGMARSIELINEISRMTNYIGPIEVVTGDEEMTALAAGPVRVLAGKECSKQYTKQAI
ncbi:MAG: butyrate kinase [Pseudodesulfovibrio sp.]